MEKITAVVPAYNEEKRIIPVLEVLENSGIVSEIIVINDGSTDKTKEIINRHSDPINLINLPENQGKGSALQKGIEAANTDILLFVDADLVGFKKQHIIDMVSPVLNENIDMTVGVFTGGRIRTDLSQKLFPFISGQRCLKKWVLDGLDLSGVRYEVEIVITKHIKKIKVKVKEVMLNDMTHIMKEEKLGLIKGALARGKMYQDITNYYIQDGASKISGLLNNRQKNTDE